MLVRGQPHQAENNDWRQQASKGPGEEIKGRQDELEKVCERVPYPLDGRIDPLDQQQERYGYEETVMIPYDGRSKRHQYEEGRDGIEHCHTAFLSVDE